MQQTPLSVVKYKLVFLGLLLFLISACQPSPPLQQMVEIKKRGVLRVGTLYGSSTYYVSGSGPTGFEYELAQQFADYLDVKLEIYPGHNLSELLPRLEHNNIDLIAAGLEMTAKRKEVYRFSPPYLYTSQKLIFKQGAIKRPRDLDDLEGQLLVMADSSHAENLHTLKSQHPHFTWQETKDHDADELMQMVLDETIDYTIIDSVLLDVARRKNPELSIGFTIQEEQPLGWAIRRSEDDSFYSAMIEFFGHQHQSGEILALEDKYFGHVQQFNYVDTRLFIKAIQEDLPKYKDWFKQYAIDADWRLLAALSYQESHWDPRARSRTGVRGIMMLTQPTANLVGVKSRLDAEQNIRGGAEYFARLLKQIPDRIPEPDRIWFALASYNIGWGHLEDARRLTQRQGANPDKWIDVRKRLPLLQQKKYYQTTRFGYARGNEAVTYVANIRRYYDTLVWLEEEDQNLQTFEIDDVVSY